MHIEFNMKYQMLNSNVFGNNLPEEKDWLLTLAELTYVKRVTNPDSNPKKEGYEYNQKRYDDIRELISTISLPLRKGEDNTAYAVLPYNYLRLDNDITKVYDVCGKYDSLLKEVNKTEYIYFANLISTDVVVDWATTYSSFGISWNGSSVFDMQNDVPYLVDGISSQEEFFILLNAFMSHINTNQPTVKCYWEKYDNIFKKDSIIFVSETALTNAGFSTDDDDYSFTEETINYTTLTNTKEVDGVFATNRLVKNGDVYDMLGTTFHTTKPQSPLSTLNERRLTVYHNKKFIPQGVKLVYIRKPKGISVSLNINSELDSSVHSEIVDIAVELAAAYNNTSNYRNILNQNLRNE